MCQGSIRPSGLVKSINEGSINEEDCAYKPFLNHLCATTNCTAHISLDPEALYAITLNVIYRRIYPAPHPLVSSDSRGLPGHLPSPCSCPRGFNSPRRSARGSWGRPNKYKTHLRQGGDKRGSGSRVKGQYAGRISSAAGL